MLVFLYTVYNFPLSLGEQTEDTEDTGAPPPATHVRLPCRTLLGTWEALLYEDGLKDEVLKFAIAALGDI